MKQVIGLVALSAVALAQDEVGQRSYRPGGAALEWVGEDLAVADVAGIRMARLGQGQELLFGPFFEAGQVGMLPVLDAVDGLLGGVTGAGDVVIWNASTGAEVGRRAGGAGLAEGKLPLLVLAAGGRDFVIGDGGVELFKVSLDSPFPMPAGYSGPGKMRAMEFDQAGDLVSLPSGWKLSKATGAWIPGDAIDYEDAEGANRLAWDAGSNLLAMFRHERPSLLRIDDDLMVGLGYRSPMDMALDPAGDVVLVSLPGSGGAIGSGPLSDVALLGSLEVFGARTGEHLDRLPREGAQLSPFETAEHRTLGLGLRMVALGDGRFATVDLVEHHGSPALFLRLRGRDLLATGEFELSGGMWPLHLAVGSDLLAVAYVGQGVDLFKLGDVAAADLGAIAPVEQVPIADESEQLGNAQVFAMAPKGGLLVMGYGDGRIRVSGVQGTPLGTLWAEGAGLPEDAGRLLALRFDGAMKLVATTEEDFGLSERVLDLTDWKPGGQWQNPRPVRALGEVSADGKRRVELVHGEPGNLDIYLGAVEDGELFGHLIARRAIGPEPLDALAISGSGDLAWARDGYVFRTKVELAEVGVDGE